MSVTILEILLWFNVSLLFIHEMDAVFRREWNLMIILKDMDDEKAHYIFTAAHVLLYMAILYLSVYQKNVLFWIIHPFSIFHLGLHRFFSKHKANELNNWFSKAIIYVMALTGVVSIFSKVL